MNTILHITPHLGGGVGRVLLAYLGKAAQNPEWVHRVLSLEYANSEACLASRAAGFSLRDRMSGDHEGILAAVSAADVVLVHWWNHPLLSAFLVRETLPPARVVFWSHVSGLHAPYVFPGPALRYPDLFVFTTPVSFQVPEVERLPATRREALRTIWSTGGVEQMSNLWRRPHDGFVVGYIGTVDYCKMHPHFLRMSAEVGVPDTRFVVCGGPGEERIRQESRTCRGGDRFDFTGPVEDVGHWLSGFDVFGYPLAPYHYGTCEQSLCEAMAAGVPPIVLANPAERHIVKDGVTGVVAADEEAYPRAVESLAGQPALRADLGENARKEALRRFSLGAMLAAWESVFREALSLPKTVRRWTGGRHGRSVSAAGLFLEFLGDHGADFARFADACGRKERESAAERIRSLGDASPLWKSRTRGTPRHYRTFFPEDWHLRLWSDILGGGTGEGRP